MKGKAISEMSGLLVKFFVPFRDKTPPKKFLMYHFEKISWAKEFSETKISKFLKVLWARFKTTSRKKVLYNFQLYIVSTYKFSKKLLTPNYQQEREDKIIFREKNSNIKTKKIKKEHFQMTNNLEIPNPIELKFFRIFNWTLPKILIQH